MSTDRQVQINHNNAEKIVLETKRLRIIFVATIVSIIIVSIGLLDIGVSFILALVSVILIYLLPYTYFQNHTQVEKEVPIILKSYNLNRLLINSYNRLLAQQKKLVQNYQPEHVL